MSWENSTLSERQRYYYNANRCIYCEGETELIDSIEVYQESHGLIYICRPCQAWVGVHHGHTDQSYGTVAKKQLRNLRHEAHKWFDPLWLAKKKRDNLTVKGARAKGYAWLSKLLGIEKIESHIGYFNEEQCRKVIEECKKYFK